MYSIEPALAGLDTITLDGVYNLIHLANKLAGYQAAETEKQALHLLEQKGFKVHKQIFKTF